MNRHKFNLLQKNPLIKEGKKPMSGISTMQINSITTSPAMPVVKAASSQASTPASEAQDQAVLNFSPDSFSSLVHEANNMPEVRSEVVDAYRSRIQAGIYPSQETVTGLVDLLGGSIVQMAQSGSAS